MAVDLYARPAPPRLAGRLRNMSQSQSFAECSGDLLMMFHSAESGSKDVEAVNPTAAGDVDSGAARTSSDEATALLETLFASIAKLDQHSRASVLSRLRSRINELDAETGLEQSATNELESPSLDTTQSLVSEIETAVQHTETTPAAPRR
ncbi:hypothetical protein HYQ44_012552 [Verticillium longisporum]|nr:hypothetical protein HYQ44_012552 [Verticillium longisporum]